MSTGWLSAALVGVPLAAALGLALAPLPPRAARWLAQAAAAAEAAVAALVWLAFQVPPAHVEGALLPVPQLACSAPWLPALGVRLELAVDGVNLYAVLALVVALIVAVVADGHLDGDPGCRPRLVLVWAAGAGLALFLLSRDLLLAAAGHGLAGLSLTGLLALGRRRGAAGAARRFGTWATAGTLLWAAAAAAASQTAASTVLDDVVRATGEVAPLTALLLGVALAMQVPLVPFHTWLAPACVHGSAAGRVLVPGAWCAAGLFGLVRYAVATIPLDLSAAAPWPALGAAATALYGALLALSTRPEDLGRRVAWVCLSWGGLVAAGVCSLDAGAVSGAALFAAAQGPLRAVLMVLAASFMGGAGGVRLAAVWTAVALAAAAAPGGGVFPGWLALVAVGHGSTPWLAPVLVGATGLAAFALVSAGAELARPRPGPWAPPALRRAVLAVLLLSLASGLQLAPFSAWVRPEVERLLTRTAAGRIAPVEGEAAPANEVMP